MGVFEFQSTDPGEFRERVRPVADPDRVLAVRARFHCHLRGVRLPRLGILRLDICGGRVVFEGSRDYGFTASLGEPMWAHDGRTAAELNPKIAQAGRAGEFVRFDVPGRHAVLATQMDPNWIESEAARARCDLSLRRQVSVGSGTGAEFLRALIRVFREFDLSPSLLDDQRAVQEHEIRLLDLYLGAACDDDDTRDGPATAVIRRAEEFMLAHLEAPVPVTHVAEAARVPLRTLHRAFQRHHGVGPSRWLRERRLDAVQRELLVAAPDEKTVTEVALRYGFDHLGRFGQQYRRSFGESPSQTLAS